MAAPSKDASAIIESSIAEDELSLVFEKVMLDASELFASLSSEDESADIATDDELSLASDSSENSTSSDTEDAFPNILTDAELSEIFEKFKSDVPEHIASSSAEDASANIATDAELSLVSDASALITPSATEDAFPTMVTDAEISLAIEKLMSDAAEHIAPSSAEDASANIATDADLSLIFEKLMSDASELFESWSEEDASANIATDAELSLVSDASANIASSSVEDASVKIAPSSTEKASENVPPSSEEAAANIVLLSTEDASASIASSSTEDASENIASSSADTAGSGTSQKMIILKSVEGETLEVEEAVAFKSETIKKLIESNSADISLNVTTSILMQVIKYCKRHVEVAAMASGDTYKELKEFDDDFVKVGMATMFQIIRAADYLGIQSLVDLTCQYMADYIKDRSPEDVREIFNIKSTGFSVEEEKRIRRETEWAYAGLI